MTLPVKGVINDTPCDKMFIDSGCEVTCVAKHLVPTSAYTGKTTLLKGTKLPPSLNHTLLLKLGFDFSHMMK